MSSNSYNFAMGDSSNNAKEGNFIAFIVAANMLLSDNNLNK
jgi:hypothetical protein